MDDENKRLIDLAAGDSRAIRIGDQVLYPPVMVGGRAFQFDAYQNGFLYALQKFAGDMDKACNFIGKPLEWANKFVQTQKFRKFRNAKLANASVKSGDLVDFFWESTIDGAKGYKEWYTAECQICHESNHYGVGEAEAFRNDNMVFEAKCLVCFQPVTLEYHKEEYKPTREQIQCLQMIGDRVSPKIERISHEFSGETFSFQCEEQ